MISKTAGPLTLMGFLVQCRTYSLSMNRYGRCPSLPSGIPSLVVRTISPGGSPRPSM